MKSKPTSWRDIGRVRLRNTYCVECSANNFRVSSTSPKGAGYSQLVPEPVVTHFRKIACGQTVTVDEAMRALARSSLQLPYQYGYKLRFFAQNVLVVLVALGKACQTRVGHRFEYDIY